MAFCTLETQSCWWTLEVESSKQRGSCVLSIIADSSNITSQSDTNSVPHLLGPLQVGGAHSMTPCVRNAFIISKVSHMHDQTHSITHRHTVSDLFYHLWSVFSVDGTSDGEVLRYDQSFALRTTAGFAGEVNKQMACIQFYVISESPSLSMQSVGFLTAIPRQWSQNISEVC